MNHKPIKVITTIVSTIDTLTSFTVPGEITAHHLIEVDPGDDVDMPESLLRAIAKSAGHALINPNKEEE